LIIALIKKLFFFSCQFCIAAHVVAVLKFLDPADRQVVLSRILGDNKLPSALREAVLPLGDVSDQSLRTQLQNRCRNPVDTERLLGLSQLLECSLLDKSIDAFLTTFAFIKDSSHREAWERRTNVYLMLADCKAKIVKTLLPLSDAQLQSLTKILLEMMAHVLEAQEMFANPFTPRDHAHPLYLFIALSTEMLFQTCFEAHHPLFQLGVLLQWELHSRVRFFFS
jgi:hypothetical protein